MVVGFFLELLSLFLNFVALIIPNWTFPPLLDTGFITIMDYAISINGYFPILHVLFVLQIIFSFHLMLFTVKVVSGFISLIRGGGALGNLK